MKYSLLHVVGQNKELVAESDSYEDLYFQASCLGEYEQLHMFEQPFRYEVLARFVYKDWEYPDDYDDYEIVDTEMYKRK